MQNTFEHLLGSLPLKLYSGYHRYPLQVFPSGLVVFVHRMLLHVGPVVVGDLLFILHFLH